MLQGRRAFYFQLGGFACAIVAMLLVSRFLPVIELISKLQHRVAQMGTWSGVCYPLLFATCNILLLPGGILSIGAGFFFGLWWGFFIVLIGNTISAAVSFGVSRWVGSRWLGRDISRSPMLAIAREAVERDAWKIIFLSQLHPLFPTSLLNYFYGLTRIRFGAYMFWTTAGRAPGLFLYTYLGTLGQLGLNMALGKTHPRIVEYWTWGGAFVVTVLLFVMLTRITAASIRQSRESNDPSGVDQKHAILTR
jgi:uncharacterized membrane protein YdjX (TVP38/TMEM64 family)